MKMTKIALLASAALAAVSMSARADDLSDLKARIAALEANAAATSVPAGYSLMTIGTADTILAPGETLNPMLYGAKASNIAIMPTADMPASTNIQWSGFVRAALVYKNKQTTGTSTFSTINTDFSSHETHIKSRGELTVKGTTDTAVGEVGAQLTLRSEADGATSGDFWAPTAWGWWKMTPDLSLGAGFNGSVGGGGWGTDNLTAMYSDGAYAIGSNGDRTQFRLTYASGPITIASAVEHYDVAGHEYGFAGSVKYAGDSFSAGVNGYMHDSDWQAQIGATASMDMFTLSAAAAMGHVDGKVYTVDYGPLHTHTQDTDYWKANIFAKAALSDAVSAELGYGYVHNDGGSSTESHAQGFAGGLYYTPVSQLTIGAEASWNKESTNLDSGDYTGSVTSTAADLVTVFRF